MNLFFKIKLAISLILIVLFFVGAGIKSNALMIFSVCINIYLIHTLMIEQITGRDRE